MDVQQSSTSSVAENVVSGCPVLCSMDYGSTDSSPTAEHGSCDNAEATGDGEGSNSNQEIATADSTSNTRSASPDLTCPICLGRLENRSYTDTCFHKFCFVCLVEWSKVKPVCPLCKQPFTSVIHNVQSYEDFQQLPITSANSTTTVDSNRSRFRYPTTVIQGRSERRRQQESLQRPSRHRRRGSSRFDVPPPAFTSSFRRSIYRDELWVRSVNDSRRYREATAAFFAHNPASVHRLMPWLNRELMALLRNPADVIFILEVILSTVLRLDITSETFYDLVAPFLGARTRHFIHEFYTFAQSPFNMEAYDTRAVYVRPPQIASNTPIEFSDSDNNSSDTDIVEISPLPSTSNRRLIIDDDDDDDDDHPVNEGTFSQQASVENATRDTSSPQPGPSHVRDIPFPGPSRQVQSWTQVLATPPLQNPHMPSFSGHDGTSNVQNIAEDSDDEIEIVAQDKPWRERSPVVLSSSDSDTDNIKELPHRSADNSSAVATQASVHNGLAQEYISTTNEIASSQHHLTVLGESDCDAEMNRPEIAVIYKGSEESSHRSKHRHKKSKKHKRRHHKDCSRHKSSVHKSDKSDNNSVLDDDKKGQRSPKSEHGDFIAADSTVKHRRLSDSVKAKDRPSSSRYGNDPVLMSDNSSDSSECQTVRSVVVVPQTCKKNSSGHKRSQRDSE